MTDDDCPIETARLLEGLDCLRIAIALFDADDRLSYANQHLARIFPSAGPDVGRLTGLTFEEFVRRKLESGEIGGQGAVQDPEAWLEQRLSHHRTSSAHPLVTQLSDGRWMESSEQPTPDGGIVVRWIDVTERHRHRIQLEDTITGTTEGYALWDASGRLTMCNRSFAERVAGRGPMYLIGLHLAEVLECGLRSGLFTVRSTPERWIGQWLAIQAEAGGHLPVEMADGRWLRVTFRRTRDGGSTTAIADITEQQEAELGFVNRGKMLDQALDRLGQQHRELAAKSVELKAARDTAARAEASRTAFLRNMSHELRTPLNSIIGFAEVLEKEVYGPLGSEEYGEYATMVASSGRHLLGLINRILDLTRLEAGRYAITLEPGNIGELVREAAAMLRPCADDVGVTIEVSEDAGQKSLMIDETAIRQVMLNLLSNAIRFSERGGVVTARMSEANGGCTVTITDNGVGIPEADLDRIMLPFEQVRAARNRRLEGIGLGLPISQSLIELHGGTVALRSTPGQGTTVGVWLPRADYVRQMIAS